jgi:hypothetical protein
MKGYAELPTVEFNFLAKQNYILRCVLSSYLFIKKINFEKKIDELENTTDYIHKGIMNIEIRNVIIDDAKIILDLVKE